MEGGVGLGLTDKMLIRTICEPTALMETEDKVDSYPDTKDWTASPASTVFDMFSGFLGGLGVRSVGVWVDSLLSERRQVKSVARSGFSAVGKECRLSRQCQRKRAYQFSKKLRFFVHCPVSA